MIDLICRLVERAIDQVGGEVAVPELSAGVEQDRPGQAVVAMNEESGGAVEEATVPEVIAVAVFGHFPAAGVVMIPWSAALAVADQARRRREEAVPLRGREEGVC